MTKKLLKNRKIFLFEDITNEKAEEIIKSLYYLENKDSEKDILLLINSFGGDVYSGLAIYDVMQNLSCDVRTYGIGYISSMAQILLTAGTKGKRFVSKHSKILLHQPVTEISGELDIIEKNINELNELKDTLCNIISFHTNQPKEKVEKDMKKNIPFSPEKAIKYGLVDKIISSPIDFL